MVCSKLRGIFAGEVLDAARCRICRRSETHGRDMSSDLANNQVSDQASKRTTHPTPYYGLPSTGPIIQYRAKYGKSISSRVVMAACQHHMTTPITISSYYVDQE